MQANLWFQAPPFTGLPSGEALSDTEVGGDMMLSGASADVQVCFYQYEMPVHLRQYFGVQGVPLELFAERARHHRTADADGFVHFRVRVLPMGWSWSVHIVQALHLEVFRRAGLSARFLQDKLSPGALEYAR